MRLGGVTDRQANGVEHDEDGIHRGGVTCGAADPLRPSLVATMVAVPSEFPDDPPPPTVATEVLPDDQ